MKPMFTSQIIVGAIIAVFVAGGGAIGEEKASPVEAAKAAIQKAATERVEAERIVGDKSVAAKGASEKAAAAKENAAAEGKRAEKLLAEKTAAEKSLADKTAALRKAEETVLAEEAFAADEALTKAISERTAAEKTLAEKTTAEKKAVEEAAAATAAAGKATADESQAKKLAATLATSESAAAAKSDAEKLLAQKMAAITPALDRQASARAALLGGLKPLAASAWDYDKARHLLNRAGFGGTPEEVAKLCSMGLHAAVEHLVEFQKLPPPNVHADVRLPERATPYENRLTPTERSKLENERTSRRFQQEAQLRQSWLRRMAETQRPLEEKLTLFWHGHFAVSFLKNENPHAMYRQNHLFREYGAVNYAGLLRGIAQDPAMITYLDNQVNFKGSGNENLGREILELFSLGEGQGYTEQDLREASRALTGYSHDHWTGQFKFIATRHDSTPKTVFGQAGNWGGDDLVDLILKQTPTARFIATKLFQYFAHGTPSTETIDRLAHTLRLCNYELAPALENLFLSEEFYSDQAMRSRIKNPAELMVGSIRALGLQQVDYAAVDNALQKMGQTLFEPPNVKGWEEGRAWINANRVLIRYNEVASLVENSSLDLVATLEGKGVGTPVEVVDHFARRCLAVPLTEDKRTLLIDFLSGLPPCAQWADKRKETNAKLRALLIALLSTPEYQLTGSYPPLLPFVALRAPACLNSFNVRNPVTEEPCHA